MAKGTKLVRYTRTDAGPDGTANAGEVRRVTSETAKVLVEADAAVVVTESGDLESAAVEPAENAAERTAKKKVPAKKKAPAKGE